MHRKLDGGPHANSLLEAINATRSSRFPAWARPDSPALACAGSLDFTSGLQWLDMAWKGTGGRFRAVLDALRRQRLVGAGEDRARRLFARTGARRARFRAVSTPGSRWREKGVDDDSGLYFSINPTRTSHGWRAQENIPGVGSSDAPASAWFDGAFWLAWKGVDGDSGLYFARNHDGKWSGKRRCRASAASAGRRSRRRGQPLVPSMAWCRRRCELRIAALSEGSLTEWDDPQVVACAIASGGRASRSARRTRRCRSPSTMRCSRSGRASPTTARSTERARRRHVGRPGQVEGDRHFAQPGCGDVGDVIVVAWKGVDDDHGLYFAKLTFAPGATASGIWFEWQA